MGKRNKFVTRTHIWKGQSFMFMIMTLSLFVFSFFFSVCVCVLCSWRPCRIWNRIRLFCSVSLLFSLCEWRSTKLSNFFFVRQTSVESDCRSCHTKWAMCLKTPSTWVFLLHRGKHVLFVFHYSETFCFSFGWISIDPKTRWGQRRRDSGLMDNIKALSFISKLQMLYM